MSTQDATICRLQTALTLIGNLPLEFNTRARAIAQEARGEPPPGGWRDPLTPEQIYKVLYRDQMHAQPSIKPTEKEKKTMSTETRTETETTATPYVPPVIEMIPVTSSNIEGVGHDGNVTLRMKFKSGVFFYDYVGISEAAFLGLVNSDSVGKTWKGVVGDVKGIKFEFPAA